MSPSYVHKELQESEDVGGNLPMGNCSSFICPTDTEKKEKKARNVSAFEPGLNVKWGMGKWPVVGNNNHSVIFFVGEKALITFFMVSCSNLHTMIVIQAFKHWVLLPKPSQTSS